MLHFSKSAYSIFSTYMAEEFRSFEKFPPKNLEFAKHIRIKNYIAIINIT
jgi:hypothetical protein